MLDYIKTLNQSLIKKYEKENKQDLLIKQKVISKILSFNNCFNKINIQTAYSIFNDLCIPKDNWNNIYIKLLNENKK